MSRLFHQHKSSVDLDSDSSTTPTQSVVDQLNDIAADHWLSVEQLHNLYIIAARTSFSFPPVCCAAPPPSATDLNGAASPTSSPHLSPCSPPLSRCEPRRHCPECCSRFSSKPSAVSLVTVNPGPHQGFRLLSLEPNLPPASPADVIAEPSGFGSCSYRSALDRDNLYRSRVRPTIEALLLETTPLDKDDLSIVLDYLIDPPQLSQPQICALALLSPQLLTDTKPTTNQPAQSAAYSDLLLTHSGCFTHRKGMIDRTISMRAKQMRLNFATIQTGLYRVTSEGQVRMSVYNMSEFYFDQHLHDEKRKRVVGLNVEPFDEKRLDECRQHELCMANQLLLVWGQGV